MTQSSLHTKLAITHEAAQLQVKKCQQPREPEEAEIRFSLRAFWGSVALLTPDFGLLGSRSVRIRVSCFNHPVCGNGLGQLSEPDMHPLYKIILPKLSAHQLLNHLTVIIPI